MMLYTPIARSTFDDNMMAPFVMNMISRILQGSTIFINYEESDYPYITGVDGCIPDRESFEYFVSCVRQWYETHNDVEIDLFNKLTEFENLVWLDKEKHPKAGYIYIIKSSTGHYKVGRTKSIPNRMNYFGVKLPFEFEVILTLPVIDMYRAEQILHYLWQRCRVNGEWFDLTESELNYFVVRLGKYDIFVEHPEDQVNT